MKKTMMTNRYCTMLGNKFLFKIIAEAKNKTTIHIIPAKIANALFILT